MGSAFLGTGAGPRERHNPFPGGLGMCLTNAGALQAGFSNSQLLWKLFPDMDLHGKFVTPREHLLLDPGLIWPKLCLITLEKLPKPCGVELSGPGCD